MTRVLLKKQMMEIFSWIYQNRRNGKNRSALAAAGVGLLNLAVIGFLGGMFYFMAEALCPVLAAVGLGWLYFAMMGLIALLLGVFGSVFSTCATLYQARDNDLLLSMPVPPGRILLVRLLGVYAMGLLFELIVMVPAVIVWLRGGRLGAAGIVCTLLLPLGLSLLVLVCSALFGWLVAMVSARLRNRSFVTVFLSLLFIAAYYYCYANAQTLFQGILADPAALGGKVRIFLYPLYHMGLAAEGNLRSMLFFSVFVGLLSAVMWLVLSRSFLSLLTSNRGAVRQKYRERSYPQRSVGRALFGKELGRFLGSSVYMLNCSLGIVLMPVLAVALIWKREVILKVLPLVFGGQEELLWLLVAAAVCAAATMNDTAAPSISLEGKNLWLIQVLPVSGRQALAAKLRLHLTLTLLPAALLVAAAEWVLRPPLGFALLLPAVAALFILLMGALGLCLNLKLPNLTWTNETIPVKQGMSVGIALFGGWALVAAAAGGYYLLRNWLRPLPYLVCIAVLLAAASAGLLRWLWTKGAGILEGL